MAESLNRVFGKKLLYLDENYKISKNVSQMRLKKLKNKVIIYCYDDSNGKGYKDTEFEKIVNITNNPNNSSNTYKEIISNSMGVKSSSIDMIDAKENSLKKMSIVFTINSDLSNYNTSKKVFRQNGVQISTLNFSNISEDPDASPGKEHWDFFNENKSAFVEKPSNLIYKKEYVDDSEIKKADPKHSYATKKMELLGGALSFNY